MNDSQQELMISLLSREGVDPALVSILYRLFCRVGADPHTIAQALSKYDRDGVLPSNHALPPVTSYSLSPIHSDASPECGEEILRAAIKYGIRLAQVDDDYTHDDEYAKPEGFRVDPEGIPLHEADDPIYANILPEREQETYDLMFPLLVASMDLQNECDDEATLSALDHIRETLYENLHGLEMRKISVPLCESDWNCPDDRYRYYFKLGVLKYLERHKAVDSSLLGSGLNRRTKGYNVDRVFRNVLAEIPALQSFVEMEMPRLLAMSEEDIRCLLSIEPSPSRSPPSSE